MKSLSRLRQPFGVLLWFELGLGLVRLGLFADPAREAYTFVTIAGSASVGSTDGLGPGARFNLGISSRSGVASAGDGVVYVADTHNHLLRRILPSGEVSTVAGSAGVAGAADGTGANARFRSPTGIACDAEGTLWVADTGNRVIRKVDSKGVVSTLPGSYFSSGIAVSPAGMVYVADFAAGVVVKLDRNGKQLESIRGFSGPTGIAVDVDETLYVAEYNTHVLSKVTPSRVYSVFAGSKDDFGSKSRDGIGGAARFDWLVGLSLDRATGTLYAVDEFAHTLRQVTRDGTVTTLAGLAGNPGNSDGFRSAARLYWPQGVAVDDRGIYISDAGNNIIRKASATGVVTTLAGIRIDGDLSASDGSGSGARFANPGPMVVDRQGTIYVVDKNRLRKISPAGEVTTLPGSFGRGLALDSSDRLYCVSASGLVRMATGESPKLLSSAVASGDTIAVDSDNTVFVAVNLGPVVRKVNPDGSLTTIAGAFGQAGATDGPGLQARFGYPRAIAADGFGNLFVTEGTEYSFFGITLEGRGYHRLRKISRDGSVSTVPLGFDLIDPQAIAADRSGNVYVADTGASLILKVGTDGSVLNIGGHPSGAGNADGTGDQVVFGYPQGVAVGVDGTVYVADGLSRSIYPVDHSFESRLIRKGWPASATIPLTTVAPVHNGSRYGFTVLGTLGRAVFIESSVDLSHWSRIFTHSPGGVFTFVDPVETGSQPRFYRATSD